MNNEELVPEQPNTSHAEDSNEAAAHNKPFVLNGAEIPLSLENHQESSPTHSSSTDHTSTQQTTNDRKWMTKYKQLIAFQQQNGHCNVKDKQFCEWVKEQRRLHRIGKLRSDREQLLNDIGFVWKNPIWMQKYKQLLKFKEKHGHIKVPAKDRRLASWVRNMRHDQIHGKLSSDRKKLLDDIGFVWRKTEAERVEELMRSNELAAQREAVPKKRNDVENQRKWMKRYRELVAFQEKNGHFNVTEANGGRKFGDWVRDQRRLQRTGKLQIDRKKLLDDIGFVWTNPIWMDHYKQFIEFKEKHGHVNVLPSHGKPSLRSWIKNQRQDQRAGKLSSDRQKLLDDIGFLWTKSIRDDQERKWMDRYKELVEYKEKNGHCKVTRNSKEPSNSKGTVLAQWVLNQRRAKRRNNLRADRQKLLDEIGFVWSDPNRGDGKPKVMAWMWQYGYSPGLIGAQKPYNEIMAEARRNRSK